MKATRKTLRTFTRGYHFEITNEETVVKTVTNPIPYETGFDRKYFPNYLRGYESCYDKCERPCYVVWKLKDKYIENRPTYTWNVAYTLYDIELTDKGKEEVERRYYMHLRNMEKYLRFMD